MVPKDVGRPLERRPLMAVFLACRLSPDTKVRRRECDNDSRLKGTQDRSDIIRQRSSPDASRAHEPTVIRGLRSEGCSVHPARPPDSGTTASGIGGARRSNARPRRSREGSSSAALSEAVSGPRLVSAHQEDGGGDTDSRDHEQDRDDHREQAAALTTSRRRRRRVRPERWECRQEF